MLRIPLPLLAAASLGQEQLVGVANTLTLVRGGCYAVVAPLVAVLWGQLPVWYLSLSAARYVYRGGLYWRRRHDRPVFDRPDNNLGKHLAAVQMAFLTAALVPTVPTSLVWTFAPVVLAPSLEVSSATFWSPAAASRPGRLATLSSLR